MVYCSHMNDERQKSQPKQKRHRYVSTSTLRSEAVGAASGIKIPTPLKVAAVIALLFGGLFVLYRKVSEKASATKQSVAHADAGRKMPSNMVARAHVAHAAEAERAVVPADNEVDVSAQDVKEPVDVPREVVDIPPAEAKPQPVRKHAPRVVLTDGKRIVRHPGGVVEVPRVFSCAGAGIKPFWVYGTHPEVEAAKEKKAREEWESLVRLAEQENL